MRLAVLLFSVCLYPCLAGEDIVVRWNSVALEAIRALNTPPTAASRNLAILHASIYDAVNGIRRSHQPYLVTQAGPSDASVEAAVAAAARKVLLSLYPARQAQIDAEYKSSIGNQNNARTLKGTQWGNFVADAILQARSNDGSANTMPYTPGNLPGQWRPTISFDGQVRPALAPHWGFVRPFGLKVGTQFRPPTPPALNTADYAADVNMVKALGSANSTARTAEQTQIALFWGYGPNTATPPGHWNQIAQEVAKTRGRSNIDENARLFALLNIAMADAAIVSWDCKFIFNLWRPITAIQEADTDGNPATAKDASWTPLLATPPFPEYTSGHSTFSAAAAVALAYFFGSDNIRFSVGSDDLPGVRRSYKSFSEAAKESGLSRIYGGIHFMSANIHGLSTGAAVGAFVSWNLLGELE